MVFRVRRCLADGSIILTSDELSGALRIAHCGDLRGHFYQNFTVCQIDPFEVQEENCAFLAEGNAFLGVVGLPQTYARSDSINFYAVLENERTELGVLHGSQIYCIRDVELLPISEDLQSEDELLFEVRKLLESRSFYALPSDPSQMRYYDLTVNTQDWYDDKGTQLDYFWNRSWCLPFLRANVDIDSWMVKMICGSVQTYTLSLDYLLTFWLISRMSSANAGTRLSARGINDYGHTANFVETEQIVIKEDNYNITNVPSDVTLSSFVMVRGSIPLFWSQSRLQVGSHRINLNRGTALTTRAFLMHFKRLTTKYGSVLPVSLVSNKGGEGLLNRVYEEMVCRLMAGIPSDATDNLRRLWSVDNQAQTPRVFVHFDFHEHCKNVRNTPLCTFIQSYMLKHHETSAIEPFLRSKGVFVARNGQKIRSQSGVLRMNCIDCLDRTNSVQTGIANFVFFNHQITALFDKAAQKLSISVLDSLQTNHKECWTKNGDSISMIYAGTNALSGRSKAGDVKRSLARALRNTLFDPVKNVVIESLILSYARNPMFGKNVTYHMSHRLVFGDESIIDSLSRNAEEYMIRKPLRISISTWNINGDKDKATQTNRFDSTGRTATLNSWLLTGPQELLAQKANPTLPTRCSGHVDPNFRSAPIDIYAIGFQEICDITASSMMKASAENMMRWLEMIRTMLNDKTHGHNENIEYVLVTREQMVGVCLFVFIRSDLVGSVSHLRTTRVKTGFMRSVGNKGCVATRFCVFSTSLCFICGHLTAGQKEVLARNLDYNLIMTTLDELLGMPVLEHDYVFFFGDFNYRINLPRNEVLDLVAAKNYLSLLSADQLYTERSARRAFDGFVEGPILFDPTYKYDYHCQIYDTSDKARIPSWCDRILWRRHHRSRSYFDDPNDRTVAGEMQYYGRAELMTSDHRPVTAIVDIEAVEADEGRLISMYIDMKKHAFESTVQLTINRSVPTPVCRAIIDRLASQLKDSFIISKRDYTMILLFFYHPEEARLYVDIGDEHAENGYVFTKTPYSSPIHESCVSKECDLLFGKRRINLENICASMPSCPRDPDCLQQVFSCDTSSAEDDEADEDTCGEDAAASVEALMQGPWASDVKTTSPVNEYVDSISKASHKEHHGVSENSRSTFFTDLIELQPTKKTSKFREAAPSAPAEQHVSAPLLTDWLEPIISLYGKPVVAKKEEDNPVAKQNTSDIDLLGPSEKAP